MYLKWVCVVRQSASLLSRTRETMATGQALDGAKRRLNRMRRRNKLETISYCPAPALQNSAVLFSRPLQNDFPFNVYCASLTSYIY